jgi:hypothetical protein
MEVNRFQRKGVDNKARQEYHSPEAMQLEGDFLHSKSLCHAQAHPKPYK